MLEMSGNGQFVTFVIVSLAAFVGILKLVTRRREPPIDSRTIAWVSLVVVVGGMVFARVGAQVGLPVALYYGLPAICTWVLPPVAFRMTRSEIVRYLPLALIMAPVIHVLFSSLLGWNDYLPFIPLA